MGKRIIQQARGKGSKTYRVRRKAYSLKIGYSAKTGEGEIIKLIHSAGHSAPLMKLKIGNEIFYNPAFNGSYVGQKIFLGESGEIKEGNILDLRNIPVGTRVYNIERNPGDGGKFIRTGGSSASITKKTENNVFVMMPSKKEIGFNPNCKTTIGTIAGGGRIEKPFVSAGKKYYKMKARNKLWPRTSAVKMNAVDHPFGSGRGKRIKSKIAKRNAPPGRKVGHLRPRQTGKRK
ncbi:50S ribosomal protein L2 [Candidatus Pacearchaeota archaeon]|nr:50S ribosomal protein L2 [Candidatus Pacearchaeota archaeon]